MRAIGNLFDLLNLYEVSKKFTGAEICANLRDFAIAPYFPQRAGLPRPLSISLESLPGGSILCEDGAIAVGG